jgi:hypothetical protein
MTKTKIFLYNLYCAGFRFSFYQDEPIPFIPEIKENYFYNQINP